MSDPAKPSLDVRPYAVHDALEPKPAHPRIVIHTSPSAAVSHVVGARFTATALNAMEVLALAAQGVRVEDPRNVLPVRPADPPPTATVEHCAAPSGDLLAALSADDSTAVTRS